MKTIAVLGSTGSIGTQTLDVAAKLGIPVAALAAHSHAKLLEEQARQFSPSFVALADPDAGRELKIRLADTSIRVGIGDAAVCEAACLGETAVTAMVGIAGLRPTLAAIDAGREIALANKETLVCAGELVMPRARQRGVAILPVDSEHSAIFQCLAAGRRSEVAKIHLTASGGPFFGKTYTETYHFTREEALRHPNWAMGAKITVDSASMMNKGFEVCEAMHLYGVPIEQIEVVVHRESIVHSMVEFCDGSVIAQLSNPDMRLPIQYALTYPERLPCPVRPLHLTELARLTFFPPDLEAFPCLALAYDAIRRGGNACAVLNGANEAAVAAFLRGDIPFGRIPELVSRALDTVPHAPLSGLGDVLEADQAARAAAAI
ncbi:MAG: 1-deoxy-D-xylulose-5-phosphate reductoisomerase [Clostridiaceae bacterium]|nr:1-deoxy-D-xylulose-5-phosphate reductoisomerase [Clostridiaceae bacterium]